MSAAPGTRTLRPLARLDGEVTVPGDKSISHRALILGSLAAGRTTVTNLSPAADVASTADCLRRCGAWLRVSARGDAELEGAGAGRTLKAPVTPLDCGNSGTTMRLLCGVLAGNRLEAVLDGDGSLRLRPMERVARPLRAMGAEVETSGGRPPVTVRGRPPLEGREHLLEVASAQVKSAILLAALNAAGETRVVEPAPSRDHTERLLRLCGLDVRSEGSTVTLRPGRLRPFHLRVPGDLSSAAFLLGLAASREGWRIRCPGVTLNPGRTGIIDVLRLMGAGISVTEAEPAGGVEPVGDVEVRGGRLHAVEIGGALVPRCIDELPLLAVLATQAEGTTRIRDAAELRLKESDRIEAVATGLRALGATCEVFDDGLAVTGPVALHGAPLDAAGDHRLAMAWSVAGCLAREGESSIAGADAVAVSYPDFHEDLARLSLQGGG